jgi:ERCC4-type nuclease
MNLIIDSREPKPIIDTIKSMNNLKNYKIEVKTLDIGDYCFYNETDGLNKIIIERKTLTDLENSIKDGRYNEQSLRLSQSSTHNHKIYYLIEGNILSNKQKKILRSAIVSISYFKGFSILNSLNQTDTAEIIYSFFDKINRETNKSSYYDTILDVSSNIEYSCVLKNQPKNNISRDNIMNIMLNQIPSISNAYSIRFRYAS